MPKHGIVNVRMVITEEKILSNIDKVQRIINPKSKKQIIELDGNSYFKDLIESIKTYLIEYPKKKNFPKNVYDDAYKLIEYATNQFEVSTKQVEELIKQKEYNIKSASILKQTIALAESKDPTWKKALIEVSKRLSPEILEAVNKIGNYESKETEEYQSLVKMLNARILNLQSNLHIEIDIERYEDRLKALSYIGIEISDALKSIPIPANSELSKPVSARVSKVEIQKNTQVKNSVNLNSMNQTSNRQKQVVLIENKQPQIQIQNQKQVIQNTNQLNNKVTIQQINSNMQKAITTKQNVMNIQRNFVAYPDQSVEPKIQLANIPNKNIINQSAQVVIKQSQFAKIEPIKINQTQQNVQRNNTAVQNNQFNQYRMNNQQQYRINQNIQTNTFPQQQNKIQNFGIQNQQVQNNQYAQFNPQMMEIQYEKKKSSLWQRLKNSKLIRAIKFLFSSKNSALALPEAQNGYNRY